jgi:uncharacterized membrane protein
MTAARVMQQFGPYMHDRTGLNHPWLVFLFFVFVAAAVAVGVWLLVRGTRHPYPPFPAQGMVPPIPPTDPALDTLRLRFARGEIDADEYAARAALLSGGAPPGPTPG